MRIKICGITQPDQGLAIAHLGATALGFICVPSSPRYVPLAQLQAIATALLADPIARQIDRIGVFADAPLATIRETVAIGQLTAIQLHGQEDPDFCQQVRQHFPQQEVIKACRVPSNVAQIHAQIDPYFGTIDTLLLDAYHPQQLGGTGQTLDWQRLQTFQPPCPWFLAGGLTPANVREALQWVQPQGVDLSSGVEVKPGVKDLAKVKQLFQALASVAGYRN
ncbi:phosphoribosylanthranilate isomerase [Trichothermofontia sp.]